MKKAGRKNKTVYIAISLMVCCFGLCGCADTAYETVEQKEMDRVYEDGKYGYENDDDYRKDIPCIYEDAYSFSEGLACVALNGKYGYIDTEGNEVVPFVYDAAAPFSEGLAYFEKEGAYGFIDKEGREVFRLDCDSVSSFHEGLAFFSIDGKYGYIDKTGTVVIEALYDDAGYFENGLAIVRIGGKKGVIDAKGNEVIPIEEAEISFDEEPYIRVGIWNSFRYFNWNGKELIPCDRKPDWNDRENLDGAILTNVITPRAGKLHEFTKEIKSEIMEESDAPVICLYGLYSVAGWETPVLYCAAVSKEIGSYVYRSGLYAAGDNEVESLTVAYDFGGSAGGGDAGLYFDESASNIVAGRCEYIRGFDGYAYKYEIEKYADGEIAEEQWYRSFTGDTTEYEEEELLLHAGEYYDEEEGNAYTRDTILEADWVTQYWIGEDFMSERMVTYEEYHAVADNYREITIIYEGQFSY